MGGTYFSLSQVSDKVKKSKEKCSHTYNSLVSISCFYFNLEALKRDFILYPAQVDVMCETSCFLSSPTTKASSLPR